MAVGRITRGTTGTNRLRRMDRWLARHKRFLAMTNPTVVDLGYGAAPWTALELFDRLSSVNAGTTVVGIEIDPERVQAAVPFARDGVSFHRGGFEVPLPGKQQADVIRAFNVLRQYDEPEVAAIWDQLRSRLAPGGILIDGTCDEIGRVSTWVSLGTEGPETFTVSLRLEELEVPSIAAERLIKALIHRNVPGERIHAFFVDLDRYWAINAPLAVYSPIQRWVATARMMKEGGWPVLDNAIRHRLGDITVTWEAVSPQQ